MTDLATKNKKNLPGTPSCVLLIVQQKTVCVMGRVLMMYPCIWKCTQRERQAGRIPCRGAVELSPHHRILQLVQHEDGQTAPTRRHYWWPAVKRKIGLEYTQNLCVKSSHGEWKQNTLQSCGKTSMGTSTFNSKPPARWPIKISSSNPPAFPSNKAFTSEISNLWQTWTNLGGDMAKEFDGFWEKSLCWFFFGKKKNTQESVCWEAKEENYKLEKLRKHPNLPFFFFLFFSSVGLSFPPSPPPLQRPKTAERLSHMPNPDKPTWPLHTNLMFHGSHWLLPPRHAPE